MAPPAPPQDAIGLRRTGPLAAATLASRLLGLVREVLFAAVLGAGRVTDAFVTAFRVANLARDLFAEGALSAGLVPAFATADAAEGRQAAWRLADAVLGAVVAAAGGAALLGVAAAPQLVHALAPGFAPDDAALATTLARIMMPFLPVVSVAAVAMGLLHGCGRLGPPAVAPALFNVGAIAVGAGLWAAHAGPRAAVVGWAWGTLLGGVLQAAVQLPALWRLGYRPRPALRAAVRHPGVRAVARAGVPAVVGLSAMQVNLLVGNAFASRQVGAVSWLNYAFPLVQLPLGVFGIAVASVAGAGVAQRAAMRDVAGARALVADALRLVAFFAVPSTVGLVVLAEPIVALLYQRSAFGAADAAATAGALVAYAPGLYAYAAVKVLAPAFYGLDGVRVPVAASVAGMLAHALAAAALAPGLGYAGVALAATLGAAVNAGLLAAAWRWRHAGAPAPGGPPVARHLAQVAAASAVLGAVAWAVRRGLAGALPGAGLGSRAAVALVPILCAGAAYLATARALGARDLEAVLRRPGAPAAGA